ncbi:MAG: hypothetical protein K2Z81_25450, partial [Cyanobacteria bacterium]|nr:hypothetical protein [Cyanobacteriota bacterium]
TNKELAEFLNKCTDGSLKNREWQELLLADGIRITAVVITTVTTQVLCEFFRVKPLALILVPLVATVTDHCVDEFLYAVGLQDHGSLVIDYCKQRKQYDPVSMSFYSPELRQTAKMLFDQIRMEFEMNLACQTLGSAGSKLGRVLTGGRAAATRAVEVSLGKQLMSSIPKAMGPALGLAGVGFADRQLKLHLPVAALGLAWSFTHGSYNGAKQGLRSTNRQRCLPENSERKGAQNNLRILEPGQEKSAKESLEKPKLAGGSADEVVRKWDSSKRPVNAQALGEDGTWMTDSTRAMSEGNYAKAYEVARLAQTRPSNLKVERVPIEISVDEILSGKVADHINGMRRTGDASLYSDGSYRITEPRTIVKLPDGSCVDLINPTVTTKGTPLTSAQKATVSRVLASPHGQRLVAEHAFIMFEEMFHVRQMAEGGKPVSSLYKRFASTHQSEMANKNDGFDIFGRNRDSFEREFLIAAYEAGMPPEILQAHFAKLYGCRAQAMDFINQVDNNQATRPDGQRNRLNPENQSSDTTKTVNNKPSQQGAEPPSVSKPPKTEIEPTQKAELKRSEQPKADETPWDTRPLKKDTLRPDDPVLKDWMDNAVENLKLSPEELAALNAGLADGTVKFSVLDRKALVALEAKDSIFSFEQGQEVNSAPYRPGPGQPFKTPLKNADSYDPAKWPAATLMVKVKTPTGDKYYVTNGCRRVYVFGSEPLNPQNKPIPVIVFDGVEAYQKVLGNDVGGGVKRATGFNFATKDWTPPPVKRGELR